MKIIYPLTLSPTANINKWTVFTDSDSGGVQKTKYQYIIIQSDEEYAAIIFEKVLMIDPKDYFCDCCCVDFFTDQFDNLTDAINSVPYLKNLDWVDCENMVEGLDYDPIKESLNHPDVLFIFNKIDFNYFEIDNINEVT